MKEETKDWVALADMDLAAAEVLLERGLYPPVIFHCQQAVEKLLKAIWLERTGEVPPRTHNLVDLASELKLSLPEWESFLGTLTDQAVASRYAGGQAYTQSTAQEYYKRTIELCELLRQNLK